MSDKLRFALLVLVAILSIGFIGSLQAKKTVPETDVALYGGPLGGTDYSCSVTNVSAEVIDLSLTVYCMVGSGFCLSKDIPPTDLVDSDDVLSLSPGQSGSLDFSPVLPIKKPYRCKVEYFGIPGSLRGTFCIWSDSDDSSCVPLSE